MSTGSRESRGRSGAVGEEGGTILVWALMIMVLTSGMVISHTTYLRSVQKDESVRHLRDNLGATFADSGLSDVVNWFDRQTQQPVLEFRPVFDPEGDPPRYETIDPALGLVREFEIHGNLWGRYEIRRDETRDISSQRGGAPPGSVWEVGVRSYIYRIVDPSVPFNREPNRLLSSDVLTTELRTVKLNLPATAAICADEAADVFVGKNARLDGAQGAAIAFQDPATMDVAPRQLDANIDADAEVRGMHTEMPVTGYNPDPLAMFKMRKDEVQAFADIVFSRKRTRLAETDDAAEDRVSPDRAWWARTGRHGRSRFSRDGTRLIKTGTRSKNRDARKKKRVRRTKSRRRSWDLENSIVYSPRDLVLDKQFTHDNVLLVVDGDLTITGRKPSRLSGVLYVEGDLVIDAPLEFRGTIVVRGKVRIGEGDYVADIQYDETAIKDLRKLLNKYRARRGRSPRQ